MNLLQIWKKQIDMLRSPESISIFFAAISRQIHVLFSLFKENKSWFLPVILFFFVIHSSLFSARYIQQSGAGALLEFFFLFLLLLLRPSTPKKGSVYMMHILQIALVPILALSVLAFFLNGILYLIISSLFFLLYLDGIKRFSSWWQAISKSFLLFLNNIPFLIILMIITTLLFFSCRYLGIWINGIIVTTFLTLLFSFWLVGLATALVALYTHDAYERETTYFE